MLDFNINVTLKQLRTILSELDVFQRFKLKQSRKEPESYRPYKFTGTGISYSADYVYMSKTEDKKYGGFFILIGL